MLVDIYLATAKCSKQWHVNFPSEGGQKRHVILQMLKISHYGKTVGKMNNQYFHVFPKSSFSVVSYVFDVSWTSSPSHKLQARHQCIWNCFRGFLALGIVHLAAPWPHPICFLSGNHCHLGWERAREDVRVWQMC